MPRYEDDFEVLDGDPAVVGPMIGALLADVHHRAWSFPIPSVDYEGIRAGLIDVDTARQYEPPGFRAIEQARTLEQFFEAACGHLPDERVQAWVQTRALGRTQKETAARMGRGPATVRRWVHEVDEALCVELARRDWRIW